MDIVPNDNMKAFAINFFILDIRLQNLNQSVELIC